ncbi:M20 family metallo-hydrolase [Anaerotruncus rubiinfantis]|uniref:M20 family metallo-hydrolase n=2 Tax=Anaerotruncus rubiinfantis TaxID=1720200 RepID=UPI00189B2F52|nr:M20 family metallo-hydrolase [Anaerotruncus rubiinfantis]
MEINKARLWDRQQQIGSIGADPQGGISRFAWTPEYKEACELLIKWMEEAGLGVRVDTVGNIYGRMEGTEDLPAILSGSHFDTVPNGGKFDGLTGIMTALEALQTMRDSGYKPRRPIEMVAFVNEEASQFLGGTFGSKAMCGVLPHDYPDVTKHRFTGEPLRDAMREFGMGLDPDNIENSIIDPKNYCCFIEVHIEQGRYLLEHDLPLAVVTDIAGIKQFYITLNGISCHAGGMAMEDRHDTLAAAAAVACEVERLAKTLSPNTRGTVGYIQSDPAEHNIIARQSVIPVDYREADDEKWQKFYDDLIAFVEKQCSERGLTYSVTTTIDERPSHCHPRLMSAIHKAAEGHRIPHTEMISFPCHDAVNIERIMPMGMIFLRSSNEGLSHCPEEYTTPEDLEAGANTLLGTFIDLCENDWE